MLLTKEKFFVVLYAGIAKIEFSQLLQNPAILIAYIFAIFKGSTL